MISTIELYKAIRKHLESMFPDVKVQQKDIKNIERPSFYIQYVGKNVSTLAQNLYEDRISFNIIYFSKKDELLELLEIEETFIKAFNAPLSIPDDKYIIKVEKNSIQSNLNEDDYYLNFVVDFVLSQEEIIEETGEDIENIELTVENEDKDKITEWTDKSESTGNNDDLMSDIEL